MTDHGILSRFRKSAVGRFAGGVAVQLNLRNETMLSATCHCGQVRIQISRAPEKATNCNCSICRRLGALWAYYNVEEVLIDGHPGGTEGYVWGDKTLRTVRCKTYGCVTHWEPLTAEHGNRMAVNIRNFSPEEIGPVKIRLFDGADSWTYIGE